MKQKKETLNMWTQAYLIVPVALIGALISRLHGGGFITGVPKVIRNLLWALPFGAVAGWFYLDNYWLASGIFFAVTAWSFLGKTVGHGSMMDLGSMPRREPERLEYPILWLYGKMPEYWYDNLGLLIVGLFSVAGAAIAIGCINPLAGLIVLSGGLGKPIGYMIGWKLYPKGHDKVFGGLEATVVGELLTGFFAFGALIIGALAVL